MTTLNHLQPRMEQATRVARLAGAFLKKHFHDTELLVDELLAHDIKLRLDKETQQLITDELLAHFPHDAVLGEEGDGGESGAENEWIIDPIDGTVNYFYSIPIFCVSIALRYRGEIILGCVYDPMQDECYTAFRGQGAFCNGHPIKVSTRREMSQAVVFVGHGRHDNSGEAGIRRFAHLSAQVRKVRILGSAALTLCYIAAGRFDAYIEQLIHVWDFAAAKVILEEAGGVLCFTPVDERGITGAVTASNGLIPIEESLSLDTAPA